MKLQNTKKDKTSQIIITKHHCALTHYYILVWTHFTCFPSPKTMPSLASERCGVICNNRCTSGWKAVFGCNLRALGRFPCMKLRSLHWRQHSKMITLLSIISLPHYPNHEIAIFRISIGLMLLLELVLRFRFLHPFYSDEGTFPTHLLLTKIDALYRTICIHAFSGSMLYQQALLAIQSIFAFCLMIGYKTQIVSILSWYLYLSLTLRNTWLNFILDRYFHHLLFYVMFLPVSSCWSADAYIKEKQNKQTTEKNCGETIVTLATIVLKLQVCWIYLDAGQGKYNDPLGGWTLNADPLPALDTYARHTVRIY